MLIGALAIAATNPEHWSATVVPRRPPNPAEIHSMLLSTLLATVVAFLPVPQDPPAAVPAPAATEQPIPAPGSPEAAQLLDKGIEKMLAIGRGAFRTHEDQDNAMVRGAGLPFGNDGTDVEGGWHQDLVWGETGADKYVKNGGRMVVRADGAWKLRASKLASGAPAPFTLDPVLLFSVVRALSPEHRKVVQTATADVAGKKATVLTISIDGDAANDFVATGAVPAPGGGGFMILGGLGGMPQPEIESAVHLAFFVDPANGDVLRVAAKVYETNPMFGNVQIQVGGGGEESDDDEKEEEAAKDKESAKPEWKGGLPTKKPAKDESVMTFRADFSKLGLADAPELDDKGKALLRVR